MRVHRPVLPELGFLLLLATLWGGAYTFIRLGVETIPPITLIAARTLLAGCILLGILRIRKVDMPRDRQSWLNFFIQACLNSAVPFTLIAWAEQHVDAGLAVILNAMTPIFAFIMTALVTRHEGVSFGKLTGILSGMAGTCLIVGTSAFAGAGHDLTGELAVVFASVAYAAAAIFGQRFRTYDAMVPAAGSMLCASAMLIPLSLIVDHPWQLHPSLMSMMALVFLSVFSTAGAFVIYFRLMRTLGTVGTTAQGFVRVPIGVAISMAFLGERPSAVAWVGLVFILPGVLAMTLPASLWQDKKALLRRKARLQA
ncbi:EamA family transporter [Allorhizobium sp. BGMRC 0089]|uniref:DMT family transporter n=1 Tax=Allorhizobium sonneratiae TaxID=2934936 RepID=UPI002033C079|nr:EamA family transporter [Allorhizobium sonneratiae]MCM2294479.1 EamA family transporter [Allorhizobium sonneratiae]